MNALFDIKHFQKAWLHSVLGGTECLVSVEAVGWKKEQNDEFVN